MHADLEWIWQMGKRFSLGGAHTYAPRREEVVASEVGHHASQHQGQGTVGCVVAHLVMRIWTCLLP
jgi:hypothetical protein